MDCLTRFEVLRRIAGAKVIVDFKEVEKIGMGKASSREEGWCKILQYEKLLNDTAQRNGQEEEIAYYPTVCLVERGLLFQSKEIILAVAFDEETNKYELMFEAIAEEMSAWKTFWITLLYFYDVTMEIESLNKLKDHVMTRYADIWLPTPLGSAEENISLYEAKQISSLLGNYCPPMQKWREEIDRRQFD